MRVSRRASNQSAAQVRIGIGICRADSHVPAFLSVISERHTDLYRYHRQHQYAYVYRDHQESRYSAGDRSVPRLSRSRWHFWGQGCRSRVRKENLAQDRIIRSVVGHQQSPEPGTLSEKWKLISKSHGLHRDRAIALRWDPKAIVSHVSGPY
jgi:hypothetical protein